MADVLTPAQRRLNMSRIKGKDTKPEMLLRRGLHALGYRYQLHRRDLPGRPDLVLPRFHAVIFVHGCFWHGHKCPMFRIPSTHTSFWQSKIDGNIARDRTAQAKLIADKWRVLTIWECALRGPGRRPIEAVTNATQAWLDGNEAAGTIEAESGLEQMVIEDDSSVSVTTLSDHELIKLRHEIEKEVRRRELKLTVGDIGEQLIVEHFNSTPGLTNLQIAPRGTKNVDALSHDGDRYSIKTVLDAKKTGTIYPDRNTPDNQLFEFLLVATLSEDHALKSIHQLSWDQFLAVRRWDKRMSAWYVPYSAKALACSTRLL